MLFNRWGFVLFFSRKLIGWRPKPRPLRPTPTFTLQALSEEAFEQFLAVLADSGSGVRVDQEGVRDFDLGQQQLVQLDGPSDVGLRAGAALPPREVLQLALLLGGSISDGQTGPRAMTGASKRSYLHVGRDGRLETRDGDYSSAPGGLDAALLALASS